MNTPYYFTTDDRTTRTYKLYTTNELEPTEETRTLVMKFRYTNQSASHVYIRLFNFMTERMKKTGGCHLFQAWEEALAVDVSTDEGMLITGAMQSDIYEPIDVPFDHDAVILQAAVMNIPVWQMRDAYYTVLAAYTE